MKRATVSSKAMVAAAMVNVVGFFLLFLALSLLVMIDLGYAWCKPHGAGWRRGGLHLFSNNANPGLTAGPHRELQPLQTS